MGLMSALHLYTGPRVDFKICKWTYLLITFWGILSGMIWVYCLNQAFENRERLYSSRQNGIYRNPETWNFQTEDVFIRTVIILYIRL